MVGGRNRDWKMGKDLLKTCRKNEKMNKKTIFAAWKQMIKQEGVKVCNFQLFTGAFRCHIAMDKNGIGWGLGGMYYL